MVPSLIQSTNIYSVPVAVISIEWKNNNNKIVQVHSHEAFILAVENKPLKNTVTTVKIIEGMKEIKGG